MYIYIYTHVVIYIEHCEPSAFASASAKDAAARLLVSTAPSSSSTSRVTSKAVLPYFLSTQRSGVVAKIYNS